MKQAIFVTILCVGLSAPAWGDAKAAGREDDSEVQNFLYQGNTEKAAAHARARDSSKCPVMIKPVSRSAPFSFSRQSNT